MDVGHGNSTVIEDAGCVSIVDGGRRDALIRFLLERGITRIDSVIVSHADADHCGGISLLLADPRFRVGEVFVNPDQRQTGTWRDFLSVMIDARERGTQFRLALNDIDAADVCCGDSRLEVLAPSQDLAARTAVGTTADGKRLDANTISAVVRVWARESPRLLLTGDIDRIGFDDLVAHRPELNSDVLVFPHHGGLPRGADPESFAEAVVRAVDAQLVVFSNSRGQYGTPRPEIVATVLRRGGDVHIACTQLSQLCAADAPEPEVGAEDWLPMAAVSPSRCAGTLMISLAESFSYRPSRTSHSAFISNHAPTALCMRQPLQGSASG
ncbi:MAG: MBL fold metallo-hydrolase [Chloroflexota bacterium]|nr:MBL fold metallo-hydrolase [Chloroflexota bacterium]